MGLLEIVIQRRDEDGWPVVMVQARPGDLPTRSEGTLALDLDELRLRATPPEYGAHIGRALFRDGLRDGFASALSQARADGSPLRVLLTVEDSQLKTLHWERLFAPFDGRWDYLSLQQETPFSLYLPSLTDRRFPSIGRRDLRALLLAAGPADLAGDYSLDDFDVPATVEAVRSALGPIPCDVLANIPGADGSPDLDTLCERITSGRYTLLHVVCHGKLSSQTGETALFFPANRETRRPVNASQLIERLGRLKPVRGLPRFAFLMTCESGAPEAESGFGGLGQRLVRDLGMPAVLAMTSPVTIPTANALAGAFYTRLSEHGEPDRALGEALSGLQGRVDVSVPAVFSRLGGRALFSDALDRALTPAEVAHGLQRFTSLLPERAPVLAEPARELANRLERLANSDGLSAAALKEREEALAEINRMSEEVIDLSFNALALDRPAPQYQAVCPFPGLASFKAQDSRFFFGREALVQTLSARLKEHPFLAVLGASGSGKSSLVMAGLVPLAHHPVTLTPGAEPLESLKSALAGAEKRGLLVVDQFEELFTLCRSEDQRREFITALASQIEHGPLVITMRADFLGECAPYPALKALLQAHSELIAPMDAGELRRAIERQAETAGLRFEADLADDILEDVKSEPGAMPLLQHALLLLWQRRRGRWLRLDEYRATGGVHQAIARTADDIFTALDHQARERMRAVFLRLTRLEEDPTPGVERRDTRRRVAQDELVPAGGNPEPIYELLSLLANARLVTTSTNPVNRQREVEVAHEALIRHWPRLRAWLEEDRAGLRLGEGVREAALEWEQAARDETLLVHRGARLEDAFELAHSARYTFNQREMDYLNACQAAAEHQRRSAERRRRATIIAALGVALVMTLLALWGFSQAGLATERAATATALLGLSDQQRAELAVNAVTQQALLDESERLGTQAAIQAGLANTQAQVNLGRSLALQANDLVQSNVNLALLLGVEAMKRYPESTASQAIMAGLDIQPHKLVEMTVENEMYYFLSSDYFYRYDDEDQIHVHDLSSGEEIVALSGKIDPMQEIISSSPDGSRLAAWNDADGLVIYDRQSGEALEMGWPDEFKAAIKAAVIVKISPDWSRVITQSVDETQLAQVWDLESGQNISAFPDLQEALIINNDGTRASSTRNLIDTVSGQILQTSEGGTLQVDKFSDNGQRGIAVREEFGFEVVVIDVINGREIRRIQLPENLRFTNSPIVRDISPNGRYVAIAGLDEFVYVWDVESGQQLWAGKDKNDAYLIQFSPDGQRLLAVDLEGLMVVRDSASGRVVASVNFQQFASSVQFSRDSRSFYAIGGDNLAGWVIPDQPGYMVARMNLVALIGASLLTNSEQLGPFWVEYSPSYLVFSPDDRSLAFSTVSSLSDVGLSRVEIATRKFSIPLGYVGSAWDHFPEPSWYTIMRNTLTEQRPYSLVSTYTDQVIDISPEREFIWVDTSRDGSRAVSVLEDGSAWVWEPGTGKSAEFSGPGGQGILPGPFHYAYISPDGSKVVARFNGYYTTWDAATGEKISEYTNERYPTPIFSPDLKYAFLTNRQEDTGMLVDLQQGRETSGPIKRALDIFNENTSQYLPQANFSPDGMRMAVVIPDSGTIQVYSSADGSLLVQVNHQDAYQAVFSRDNRWLISYNKNDARVWDGSNGREMARLAHNDSLTSAALSSDGRTAASTSLGGDLRVWVWQPDDLIAAACASLERNLSLVEWRQYLGESEAYAPTCPGLPIPTEPEPTQTPDVTPMPVGTILPDG